MIHPVDQIGVGVARVAPHAEHPGGSAAAKRVAGWIGRPEIGFNLSQANGDHSFEMTAYKDLSQQAFGNVGGRALVEFPAETSGLVALSA